MPTDPSGEPKKPLARALGEFVGHITGAVRTPSKTDVHRVSTRVEEARTTDEQGRPVTLRRTTIDEVEVEPISKPVSKPSDRAGP